MGLDSNVGAMLCYIANFVCCLGLVLAIVFLFTEKENRFVKFHAVQSLFLAALQIVVGIVIQVLGMILALALNTFDMALDGVDFDPWATFHSSFCLFGTVGSGRDKSLRRTMVQAANHRRVSLEIGRQVIFNS